MTLSFMTLSFSMSSLTITISCINIYLHPDPIAMTFAQDPMGENCQKWPLPLWEKTFFYDAI